ncbi:GroES-like protein [Pseudovirgaria hyperparasitica]|uniref:GroES-like protein n=1 Tax=Pseudovirgaria hyperparasitica TaxID=470096 RepID=A0A6A6VYT2_9PEZI|nr:GroES-like protein [Pseudovirgaria hyperparasitica]KAF2754996.1 GroES-like protein [Pseudovirgaria hyperparasitica]
MKEGIIHPGPSVKIIDSPIPTPSADQVLIKVIYSGSNPKDWKIPEWFGEPGIMNQGDDIAGTIAAVGSNVTEFKPGDRVAAFHEMLTPHGSFAEYAIAWAHTTFHIPAHVRFEEAATLPLAAMTSACGLYLDLGLAPPFRPTTEVTPLLVYGGASAVGAFAIQFAVRSNIHPIIAVAGRGIAFVEGLLDKSKGDAVVDYRDGDDAVVEGVVNALKGQKLGYCFDAVSEKGSYENASKVLEKGGHIALVLPGKDYKEIPEYINKHTTSVGCVHKDAKDHGYVYFRLIGQGLKDGWFKPHPHEVIPGGISGVEKGLTNLKNGVASAVKYVFKIDETPGAERSTL